MHTLDEISFVPDANALMQVLRIEHGSSTAAEFHGFLRAVEPFAAPKAVYREAFVEARDGDVIALGGVTFSSAALAHNLKDVERVFAYVVTCGVELDGAAPEAGDPLQQFWLDAVKASALSRAREFLSSRLAKTYAIAKFAHMNPGAGDADVWPLEQQRELFGLLGDVRGAIGVTLTDSFLMLPNKTVSGVMFATEHDFKSCQLCRRAVCPGRRAPYDAGLATEMGLGKDDGA